MGVAALEGRPGVKSVDKGWHKMTEINHVVYDPEQVGIEQMIQWLKDAGTYLRVISEKKSSPEDNMQTE